MFEPQHHRSLSGSIASRRRTNHAGFVRVHFFPVCVRMYIGVLEV